MTTKVKKPPPVVLTASIETMIKLTVRLTPGAWIMGVWSIVRIDFEVYRDKDTDLWFTHVNYGHFRAVRRPANARGTNATGWGREVMYPGFHPRIEHIPLKVLELVRETYEAQGVSPEFLPPPDVNEGKAPAR